MATVRVNQTINDAVKAAVKCTFDSQANAAHAELDRISLLVGDEVMQDCASLFSEAAAMPSIYTHRVEAVHVYASPRGREVVVATLKSAVFVPAGLVTGGRVHPHIAGDSEYSLRMMRWDDAVLRVHIEKSHSASHLHTYAHALDAWDAIGRDINTATNQILQLLTEAGTVNAALKQFPPLQALLPAETLAKVAEKVSRKKPASPALDQQIAETLGARIAVAKMRGVIG